jgi:nucleotide-binding universal stress UspA family protein
MPVFFGLSGLSADLTVLANPELALLAAGLILIACVGKFVGAFVGAKFGGLARGEALALACAMNARGSTEVIVASIGLSMNVLSQNLFTLIVTMAVITTVSMPPMLRWALNRVPLREDEKIRLAREELDARGFVTNLERLLVSVDESANGKFAARIAGVIGGSSGKPTTILEMTGDDPHRHPSKKTRRPPRQAAAVKAQAEKSAREAEQAAERITTLEAHPEEEKRGSVEVTTVHKHTIGPEAIAEEARKGYDLLVIGIADTRGPKGGFSGTVSRIAEKFDGPLVVVDSHGARADELFQRPGRMLVPVNGTDASRRGAEVAFSLARATDAVVTVLYVTRITAAAGTRTGRQQAKAARRNDEAVLKDVMALAERYEVNVRRSIRADPAPDEAILKEAKRGYDLIVVGANRRPGETLFFGNTAGAVLDRLETSKLFVAS